MISRDYFVSQTNRINHILEIWNQSLKYWDSTNIRFLSCSAREKIEHDIYFYMIHWYFRPKNWIYHWRQRTKIRQFLKHPLLKMIDRFEVMIDRHSNVKIDQSIVKISLKISQSPVKIDRCVFMIDLCSKLKINRFMLVIDRWLVIDRTFVVKACR